MKRILTVILVAAIAIPFVVTSCKKGEEDPFLTIKSRTARLSQTWNCTDMTMSNTANYENWQGDAVTRTTTTTYDGTKQYSTTSETEAGVTTTWGDTVTYSIEITFDKDGTWEQTEVTSDAGTGWSSTSTTVTKGIWYWAGKNKENETKNKEVAVMETTEVVSTSSQTYGGVTTTTTDTDRYTGTQSSVMTMKCKKLSSKELIATGEGTYDDVDPDDPYTSNSSFEFTFEAE